MAINLNNTVPAAPAGSINVTWQQDASGNVSGYLGSAGTSKITVAPIAGVLTLDCSQSSSFLVNVNAVITNTIMENGTDGQEITILWQQDSSGHTVAGTAAAPFLEGPYTVSATANSFSCYKFTYNVGDNNFYQIGASGM